MSRSVAEGRVDESDGENPPARRRSRSAWIAIVGAVVCLGIASLAAWKYATRPRSRLGGTPVGAQTMADGTVLLIEQITTIRPHEIAISQPGGPLLRSWLPGASSPVQKRISVQPDDGAVVLWLTRWHPALPDSQDFDWWLTSVLIDDHGEEIQDDHEQSHVVAAAGGVFSKGSSRPWTPLAPAKNDVIIANSQLPALRQVAGSRKIRIYDRDGKQAAEFDVPFPDTSSTPQWTPDPLPATKSAGDVRVTFTRVAMKEQTPPPNSVVKLTHRRPRWSIAPTFSVERNGIPAPEWKAEPIRLVDALGNSELGWNCGLSRYEQAWKLELTVGRDAPQAFGTDERWLSPLVRLPAVDSSQPVDQQATVQQVGVTLVAIGRGEVQYADFASSNVGSAQQVSGPRQIGGKRFGVGHSSTSRNGGPTVHSANTTGGCAHLLVKLEHLPPDHRELFQVYDDQGRELTHAVESITMGDTYYGFVFVDPPADAQALSLTAYVHTARTVELFIAPPTHAH